MTDELLRYRSEFPILEHTNYMISNSLGAMPRKVFAALKPGGVFVVMDQH